jgi:Uma2 family endonuclease
VSQPQRHYTLDDYFAVEEMSVVKHEFFEGEIFARPGASLEHNLIVSNVLTILLPALRGTGCAAFGSDMRIATQGGLFTYPDVSVVCGKPWLVTGRPDTTLNPVVARRGLVGRDTRLRPRKEARRLPTNRVAP